MPLPSSVHQAGPMDEEKKFNIVQEGDQWCLISKSTGNKLGCHPTKEDAEAQERAIKANKYMVTLAQMREVCKPCADKMEEDGVRHFYLDMTKHDLGLAEFEKDVADKLREFAIGESHNIKGVEIFAEGDWNGDKYTSKDLEKIAENFKATKKYLKPYLKLGHSEDQTMLAEDSLPAAGWIKNVYVKMTDAGAKLYADFVDMPQKIYDLVRAGAYARVSSEIFIDVKVNGKKYDKALKAVALLGGETPAVQNLNDVYALYIVGAKVLAYENDAEVKVYQFDQAKLKEGAMPLNTPPQPGVAPHGAPPVGLPINNATPPVVPEGDECYKQLAQAKLDIDEMKKQMAAAAPAQQAMADENASYKNANKHLSGELENAKKLLAENQAEISKFKSEAIAKEVKDHVGQWLADKKIMPAQAPALEILLTQAKESGSLKKFKLGDKELDSFEAIVQFVDSGSGSGLPTQPVSENGAPALVDVNNGESVDQAVKTYMTKNNVASYTEAYKIVMRALKEPKK